MTRRLVARLDNVGDVLLTGPAIRAVARDAELVFLAGPSGSAAARLLPGVDQVVTFDAPWVPFDHPPVDPHAVESFVDLVRSLHIDEAVVFTSYHQSPLPLALLLRLAGVPRIAATSEDFPGALLDVRGRRDESLHEVEQGLLLCREVGHRSDPADDGRLRVELPVRRVDLPSAPYVVIHPGASVSSRALDPDAAAGVATTLTERGWQVAVTGSTAERSLVDHVADAAVPGSATPHAGDLDLADLAHLIDSAAALVCGNTGPAHLAAAVGTPVVEAFAPVVPPHRWKPWKVDHVLLGAQVRCPPACSRGCAVESRPCLAPFTPTAVAAAVEQLAARPMLSGATS